MAGGYELSLENRGQLDGGPPGRARPEGWGPCRGRPGRAGPSHLCLLQPWLHRPRLQAKSQFKRRSTANNVEIHIPVPNDADSPKFKTTVGSVKWVPENSEIVWSIKSFPVSALLSGVPLDFLPRPRLPPVPIPARSSLKAGRGARIPADGEPRGGPSEEGKPEPARAACPNGPVSSVRAAPLPLSLPPALPLALRVRTPLPLRGTDCLEA